jgi:hypothetical protein
MTYFRIKREAPWGDYGTMLAHGMSSWPKVDSSGNPFIELERTGPFIPPVSVTLSHVIVTQQAREHIERSGLTGVGFGRAIPVHVSKVDWIDWDLTASEPKRYPAGGEPENYILRRKHSDEAAAVLGQLWFLQVPECDPMIPSYETPEGRRWHIDQVDAAAHPGTDFAHWRQSITVVSDRARTVLEELSGRWLRFDPMTLV